MKVSELFEAPIPDDWDKKIFKPNVSFKKRIDYAVAQVQKTSGKGSSRTVFEIEYQGRPTILKIAHNKKGMAQNAVEAKILDDGYITKMGIAIPLIDYDEEHNEPVWIHVEKAKLVKEAELCLHLKCSNLKQLIYYSINGLDGNKKKQQYTIKELEKAHFNEADLDVFNEYANRMMELKEDFDINIMDFMQYQNWGIYENEPVVIDLGFDSTVVQQYYSK